jgi:hypothetical protein
LSLRNQKDLYMVVAVVVKNSKILVSTTRNELVLYDLRKWKKESNPPERFFTSLGNNTATALAISPNYFFVALDFEKTIAYFEFKGGEQGIYFREVKKFARNIFKDNQSSIFVADSEKFIVSAGELSDTSINVWSMDGQRLANVNTYQIEHNEINYGGINVIVRGWTS